MRTIARLIVGTVSAGAAAATLAAPASATTHHATPPTATTASSTSTPNTAQTTARSGEGAVFVQTDGLSGNRIIAFRRGTGGALTRVGSYATGGKGGVLDGAVADRLASQGSLAYDAPHALLYAVNAGSSTVSVFSVRGTELSLRQIMSSAGTFPVSLAVHDDRVYVLNAERGGSIQGFVVRRGRLVTVGGWHRKLGLDPTATPQFVTTPGQVAFAPDGRHLLVTTKASTNAIDVFAFGRLGRPLPPVVTSAPGVVPFAVVFDARGQVAVAQAGTSSVVTYRLMKDGHLTQLTSAPTGQQATCWLVEARGSLFASNAGSGTVSGFRELSGGALAPTGDSVAGAGTIDAAATPDGRHLYVQAGVGGVVDAYAVRSDGTLTHIGSVPTVVGQEGIVAT